MERTEPKIEKQESSESNIEGVIKRLKGLEWSVESLGDEGYPEPQLIRLVGRKGLADSVKKEIEEAIKALEGLKK